MIQRRSFLAAMLGAAMAPAIVKASSLMPIWRPQLWVPDNRVALIGPDGREIRGNGYERQVYRPGQDISFPHAHEAWGTVSHVMVGSTLIPLKRGGWPRWSTIAGGDQVHLTITHE